MRIIDTDALKENIDYYIREAGWSNSHNEALEWCKEFIDNAPTVEFPEQITIKCDTEEEKQKLLSALRNARVTICKEAEK